MSFLLSKGSDTLDNSEKSSGKGSKIGFIRLKSGQSVRVAFIADRSIPENIVFASAEYLNHRDFEKQVHSHPCLSVIEDCHSCEKGVPRSKRFAIAFMLLDDYVNGKTKIAAGEVGVVDVSKKQYNAIKTAVKDYIEDEAIFEMAFKLSKAGEGTDSTFAISPILKLKGDDASKVEAAKEIVLDEDFFENALRPKTNAQLRELLKNYVREEEEESEESGAPWGNDNDATRQF